MALPSFEQNLRGVCNENKSLVGSNDFREVKILKEVIWNILENVSQNTKNQFFTSRS